MPRLVTFDSLDARPWKNGGGITRQIACFPPHAGLDEFDWRLSTAQVAADGPFSRFPGIDRRLMILAGAGLDLDFAHGTERLTPGRHIDFAGEAPVSARLIDGPVTDFNIMVRRGLRLMAVSESAVDGDTRLDLPWPQAALFVCEGSLQLGNGDRLQRFDTLLLDAPAQLTASGRARLLVIGLPPA